MILRRDEIKFFTEMTCFRMAEDEIKINEIISYHIISYHIISYHIILHSITYDWAGRCAAYERRMSSVQSALCSVFMHCNTSVDMTRLYGMTQCNTIKHNTGGKTIL